MHKNYYSYNDMPQPVPPVSRAQSTASPPPHHPESLEEEIGFISGGKVLGKYETDDIILAAVIFILLINDCRDDALLLALAFIFISGST